MSLQSRVIFMSALSLFFCALTRSQTQPNPNLPISTADHQKFEALQKEFKSGPEVTQACLSCHTEAAQQIMATSHWTWSGEQSSLNESLESRIGKGKQSINNFCIALASNEPRCTSCHIGYGWKDKTFDFSDETLVDCLVCHDTTKTYKKFPVDAGHPNYVAKEWPKGSGKMVPPPDLGHVARNVGKPSRHTCGSCHFFGGGGEGVKHGDMDETLADPDYELDVHMAKEGVNFNCIQCHTTRQHVIAGRYFTVPAVEKREHVLPGTEEHFLACESCHDANPHPESKLNDHTDKVSCQACHIPTMARQRPTKMWWDWSKAGQMNEEGKPFAKKEDLNGSTIPVYDTKKGEFIWAKNHVPEYAWFNGKADYTLMDDTIDDQTPGRDIGERSGLYDKIDLNKPIVRINTLLGGYHDPNARIWPVKIHRGKQPYDPVNKTLAIPKLFGKPTTDAYWAKYDWNKAITAGMAYSDRPYSGQYDFIQSSMTWPITHMVAPKEQALSCEECHQPQGRLANLAGFYMPGRDHHPLLDKLGLTLMALVIAGVCLHGLLRVIVRKKGA